MHRGPLIVTIVAILHLASPAHGQHDPQRNASRFVADDKLDQARKALKSADQKAPETHFLKMLIALKDGNSADAVRSAGNALEAGLPFERLVAGPRKMLKPVYDSAEFKKWRSKYGKTPLIHGPMLGDVTESSIKVWVRTGEAAKVQVQVLDSKAKVIARSQTQRTNASGDFAATIRVDGLQPASEYRYLVTIDDEEQKTGNTSFRTRPKKLSKHVFRVAFGGGAGYVPKWEYMWDTILKTRPDALFMLGDNVYIDAPKQTLTSKYCYYRRQSRPEWRRLVSQTPTYAIYDDHDFGTNDCVPGPEIETPSWKRRVWNQFPQNWCNPSYGGGQSQPGCWCDFYIGDVHFIMLDGRYYRSRKKPISMLGPVQKQWLFETLQKSQGTFKVLASPVPWTVGIKPGSKDPWDGFPAEREEVFQFVEKNKIDGVFLIAADRHRTDLRRTPRTSGYDFFEFESSKLTNRHTHKVVKTEGLIWGYNKTCSFGLMKFDTTASDPQVSFEAHTIDGKIVHDYTLKLSQLKHAR